MSETVIVFPTDSMFGAVRESYPIAGKDKDKPRYIGSVVLGSFPTHEEAELAVTKAVQYNFKERHTIMNDTTTTPLIGPEQKKLLKQLIECFPEGPSRDRARKELSDLIMQLVPKD